VLKWSPSIAPVISSNPGLVADVRLPTALIVLLPDTGGAPDIAAQRLRVLSVAGETW